MSTLDSIILEIAYQSFGNDIVGSDLIPKDKLSYGIFCSLVGDKFDINIDGYSKPETLLEITNRIRSLIKGY